MPSLRPDIRRIIFCLGLFYMRPHETIFEFISRLSLEPTIFTSSFAQGTGGGSFQVTLFLSHSRRIQELEEQNALLQRSFGRLDLQEGQTLAG